MNVKSYIPLVMAAGLGLVAMVVARKALSKGGDVDAGKVTIVVAKRNVEPGVELTADDLQATKVSAAPSKTFRDPQDLVGRVTATSFGKGDAFVESLLAETGSGTGLAALVKPTYRAITVEVNEVTGVGGMLVPGSRVDVMAIVRDDKHPVPMAKTVLQNIRVSAVGRNLAPVPPNAEGGQPPASNSITLMVTPRQAQILQVVSQNGRPWLVLRNGKDESMTETEGVTMGELRGGVKSTTELAAAETTPSDVDPVTPAPTPAANAADPFTNVADVGPATRPAAAPPKNAVRIVRVIRGGVESDVSIPVPTPVAAVVAPTPTTLPVSPIAPKPEAPSGIFAGEAFELPPSK